MIRCLRALTTLAARLTDSTALRAIFIHLILRAIPMVQNAVHIISSVLVPIFINAKAGTPAGTAALALVVPRQGVATRKLPAALGARVRPLTSVELGVALEVVQPAETRLACWAFVWFLLAVGEKMTFKVVVTGKVRGAVGALVAFCAGRSGAIVLAVAGHGHAEHPGRLSEIVVRRRGDREGLRSIVGKSTVARLGSRVRGGG